MRQPQDYLRQPGQLPTEFYTGLVAQRCHQMLPALLWGCKVYKHKGRAWKVTSGSRLEAPFPN